MCKRHLKNTPKKMLVVRHIDIHSNFDYALNLSYYGGDIADMLGINISVH